jgi:diguanylate cyclase (GGDEF)-like protein
MAIMNIERTAASPATQPTIRDLISPTRWEVWTQRRSAIVYWCLSTIIALAATMVIAVRAPVHAGDIAVLAALAVMGVGQAELGRQVERVRHRIAGTVHINMTSVWLVPAILLLPPALTAVLVIVLHVHLKCRSWYRLKRVSAFRIVFTISITILTCYITRSVTDATGIHGARDAIHAGRAGTGVIALAAVAYFIVNAVIVIPGLTTTDRSVRNLIGGWQDNLLEFATLCLGALVAAAFATLPALAALIIPTVYLLHRAVLIEQLESAARQDDKTGVWNMAGWHRLANQELTRDGTPFGVLMVDLDHFKRINDRHGHLAGDAVLKAVADTIAATVRRRDSVGRFGGEEFVVLLPGLTPPHIHEVAERIRTAITKLKITVLVADHDRHITDLTASIGIATYPISGTSIERLLQAADTAMYRAKATGRNRVCPTPTDSPSH